VAGEESVSLGFAESMFPQAEGLAPEAVADFYLLDEKTLDFSKNPVRKK
jgi:hypothetical protein